MVYQHFHAAGQHLYKRFADEPEKINLPSWAPLVALVDLAIFLPILLVIGYTLSTLVPTLAIVEDPNPPAYEPVALDEGAADQGPTRPGTPVTSSLRATRRLLSSIAGWRSLFRGIVLACVIGFANTTLGGIFDSFIPFIPLGRLLSNLALTQLRTAWIHIVITAPSERKFWQRLPGFKHTFEATCFPILAVWLAEALTIGASLLVAGALGVRPPTDDNTPPSLDGSVAWKTLVVVIVAIFFQLVAVVPANVSLVRVQASLLPPDEEPILPFDRSFNGKLEPAIVGGKGFITLRDAFTSFDRASWIRLYKLYGKIIALTFATYGLFAAVVIPEFFLIMHKAKQA